MRAKTIRKRIERHAYWRSHFQTGNDAARELHHRTKVTDFNARLLAGENKAHVKRAK